MVFRGGAGVFYERFGQNNTLQALRNNGVNQLSLLVSANDTDPARRAIALALLAQPVFTTSGVTNSLTAAQILAVLPQTASSIRDVADDLQAPYTLSLIHISLPRATKLFSKRLRLKIQTSLPQRRELFRMLVSATNLR